MFDSKAKRAAALGFGLSFTLVLPPADGAISIEDAGHANTAYRYDMPALNLIDALAYQILIPAEDRTIFVEPEDRTIVIEGPAQ